METNNLKWTDLADVVQAPVTADSINQKIEQVKELLAAGRSQEANQLILEATADTKELLAQGRL
jgi:hypothetical protein